MYASMKPNSSITTHYLEASGPTSKQVRNKATTKATNSDRQNHMHV